MTPGRFVVAFVLIVAAALALVTRPETSMDHAAFVQADPFADPPGSPRIAVLGTSLTARYNWPAVLGEALSACLGKPAALDVVAAAGQTSDWGLDQVERLIAQRPDVVLVEFTVNDADMRRGLSPRDSLRRHADIIAALHAALPQTRIVLIGTNPMFGLRGLLRWRMAAYLQNYVALAQSDPRVGFVDLAPEWRATIRTRGRSEVMADGVHPVALAARQVMVPLLAQTVAALWDCPCSCVTRDCAAFALAR